jgi:hypothetical protein
MDSPTNLKSMLKRFVRGQTASSRLLTVCRAFEGINRLHPYVPPMGLGAYDSRYRSGTCLAA